MQLQQVAAKVATKLQPQKVIATNAFQMQQLAATVATKIQSQKIIATGSIAPSEICSDSFNDAAAAETHCNN